MSRYRFLILESGLEIPQPLKNGSYKSILLTKLCTSPPKLPKFLGIVRHEEDLEFKILRSASALGDK